MTDIVIYLTLLRQILNIISNKDFEKFHSLSFLRNVMRQKLLKRMLYSFCFSIT